MPVHELADLSEFLNAAVNAQVRFDANWALFLSINSAIIGGVVLIERTFNKFEKAIVILIYSGLASLSFLIASNSALLLKAIYTDLAKITYTVDQPGYHTVGHFMTIIKGEAFWTNGLFIPAIYVFAYIVVVSAIIFDEKFTSHRKD